MTEGPSRDGIENDTVESESTEGEDDADDAARPGQDRSREDATTVDSRDDGRAVNGSGDPGQAVDGSGDPGRVEGANSDVSNAQTEHVDGSSAGSNGDDSDTSVKSAVRYVGDAAKPQAGASESPARSTDVPADVRKYDKFKKIDGGTYDRANEFLRDRTYVTAREWAIARLCADFRTETGVEMTKIGENLPQLVPFMTDTYTPQAVNQARSSFEDKVRKSGATFLYGAMCDFFTAQELDDVMYEATEVAKFLLEVEGVELSVDEELEAEDRISEVMREVREHSAALRHDEMTCPECGHEMNVDEE